MRGIEDLDPEMLNAGTLRALAAMDYFVVGGEKWTVTSDGMDTPYYFKRYNDE